MRVNVECSGLRRISEDTRPRRARRADRALRLEQDVKYGVVNVFLESGRGELQMERWMVAFTWVVRQ